MKRHENRGKKRKMTEKRKTKPAEGWIKKMNGGLSEERQQRGKNQSVAGTGATTAALTSTSWRSSGTTRKASFFRCVLASL